MLAAISGQFGPTDTARAPPNAMKMPPMTAIMKHFMAGSFALAVPISTACSRSVIYNEAQPEDTDVNGDMAW